MNQINPEKLLHSKWTAAQPQGREKHFMVTALYRDDLNKVEDVELQAVLTRRSEKLPWQTLKQSELWQPGWK